MHRQLQLWTADQDSAQRTEIWENLDHQQKEIAITALARLMIKVIYSDNSNETQEKKHEQKR